MGKDGTRKKYASGGQQHVGTATITSDTRVVEEVVVIISIFYPEVKVNYHYWLVPIGRKCVFTLFL
jgi:hypothetical protein